VHEKNRKKWAPLTTADRRDIEILKKKGRTLQEIADAFHRVKSGIWYELRKKRKGRPYDAEYATHITYVRRRTGRREGKKIAMHPALRKFVEHALMDDQSPEEIAKRLKRVEKGLPYVSGFAIRRYVASPYGRRIEQRRNKIFKQKRRRRAARKRIEGKRMIDKRPANINKRWGLGHMEGDFIVSGKSGRGMVFALRDRKVRRVLMERILPVSLRTVDLALGRMKQRYPEMRTITFDNDILFLEHKKLEKKYHIRIYFCFPHSPWQKPSIEELNKILRRYIPKGSDISKYSKRFIENLEAKMNRKFMDVLGSLTPDEAYEKERRKQKQRLVARQKKNTSRSN
jgi:IS30 family transposase